MSTLEEIERAVALLPRQDLLRFREWIEDFFEDQLELSSETVAAIDQARQDIAEGKYRLRQPD